MICIGLSIGVVGLNTGALEFYRKIGFKQEGVLEDGYFYNNEYSDFIMMRILRPEWERINGRAHTVGDGPPVPRRLTAPASCSPRRSTPRRS